MAIAHVYLLWRMRYVRYGKILRILYKIGFVFRKVWTYNATDVNLKIKVSGRIQEDSWDFTTHIGKHMKFKSETEKKILSRSTLQAEVQT
jgi:hypothetical protein